MEFYGLSKFYGIHSSVSISEVLLAHHTHLCVCCLWLCLG